MIIRVITFLVAFWQGGIVLAQIAKVDTVGEHHEKIKKGWNFGAVPAVAFDSDIGIQYGAIANIYNYGNGEIYPRYKHSIYVEWSRTTKGSGINQIKYDSEYLIPNIRFSADLSYFTDQALYFYGFTDSNWAAVAN